MPRRDWRLRVSDMVDAAETGDPNNSALGVTWDKWPATLVFDASDSQAPISSTSATPSRSSVGFS